MNGQEGLLLPVSAGRCHSLLITGIIRLTGPLIANWCRLLPFKNVARWFGEGQIIVSAEQCASLRALETEHPCPLFRDIYAESLAGESAMTRARERNPSARIAIRTRYFDDFVQKNLNNLGPTQLVSLGAGMDMRPYRLECVTPLVSCYEIDIEEVIDLKKRRIAKIQPAPRLRAASINRIGTSLCSNTWVEKLLQAGFDKEEVRTIWIMEGIVYYFTDDQVKELFGRIHALSAPGSVCCASVLKRPPRNRRGPAFRSCIPDPESFLQEIGFIPIAADFCGGPEANYGRWEGEQTGGTYYMSGLRAMI
ncbi:unnamed protein product [Agarophyton chilense]